MAQNPAQADNNGFVGTLNNIQLFDLIQMYCLSRVKLVIRVTKGDLEGVIYIANGNIIHAECEKITGEEAFYHILTWKGGSFETSAHESDPPCTIGINYEFLLMEAARLMDEQSSPELANGEDPIPFQPSQEMRRVLVVDDSAIMCRVLTEILEEAPDIEVVGTAKNGEEALVQIDTLQPDLITLDVNMPVMDGSTALKHIMVRTPSPVVIISNLGKRSQQNIFNFLQLGAVDFIEKPKKNKDLHLQQDHITTKIRNAAGAKVSNFIRVKTPKIVERVTEEENNPLAAGLTVILSGPGGHAELIRLIGLLPQGKRPCLLALPSISPGIVSPLAEYLDKLSPIPVQPLSERETLLDGRGYIGLPDCKYSLHSREGEFRINIEHGVDKSQPTEELLDEFLMDAAQKLGQHLQIILLSGAEVGNCTGLRTVKENQGRILAQRLTSCLVTETLQPAFDAGLIDIEADAGELAQKLGDF